MMDEVEIAFRGETFVIRPTLGVLRQVERALGGSIPAFIQAAGGGKLPLVDTAEALAVMLRAAGAIATAEEVYLELQSPGAGDLIGALTTAIAPPATGDDDSPKPTPPISTPKVRRPATRGQTST